MKLYALSPANLYKEQIRRSLQNNPYATVDWLVFAHNDEHLLERLDALFPASQLAVVALPQYRWQLNDDVMAELIDWAIAELDIKGILLVGHSQAEAPPEQVQFVGGRVSVTTHVVKSKGGSFLDRVRQAQAQAQELEQQVALQLERLSALEVTHHHLMTQRLEIHGLFYRAESDLFYLYDPQHRNFRPLWQVIESAVA